MELTERNGTGGNGIPPVLLAAATGAASHPAEEARPSAVSFPPLGIGVSEMRTVKVNVSTTKKTAVLGFRTKGEIRGFSIFYPDRIDRDTNTIDFYFHIVGNKTETMSEGDEINANLTKNDGIMSRVIFKGYKNNEAIFEVGPRVEIG
jgi:hypothetical protein